MFMNFKERLFNNKTPITIDGGLGTLIFQKFPGYNGALELLNSECNDLMQDIHEEYLAAGAEIVETNTFGGNPIKLTAYGLESRCEELNELGAAAAKKAAEKFGGYVAGSVGPSGELVSPMGDYDPEKLYENFSSQMRGLERGGSDLIAIETMTDVQEARLAVMAAKENTSLPVLCSMSFEPNGRTLTGTDIITAFYTLAESGADIAGANCSMGPDGLAAIFKENIELLKKTGVYMSVWSNAGLPEIVDGETVYRLTPDLFADASLDFAKLGIKIIGGCCGTTPGHIRALRDALDSGKYSVPDPEKTPPALTSRTSFFIPGVQRRTVVAGERLNPSARKAFAAELKEGAGTFLRNEARAQEKEGADILDINVGFPGIDESESMERSVRILSGIVNVPLMIDSDNSEVIERALYNYPGIPVINSVNGKAQSTTALLPLIKKFGSFAIALCLDESGVHRDADMRIKSGEKLIEKISEYGIDINKIFVDPLILTESAEPGAALQTLKVISHFASKGLMTSIGLSNISFGLPERKIINSTFLKMAADAGLTAAIMNPAMQRDYGDDAASFAEKFLRGEDPGAVKYIENFKNRTGPSTPAESVTPVDSPLKKIENCVVEGNTDDIISFIKKALEGGAVPETIMNSALIAGLEKVGELYSSGEYFLPQMIASADAMKKGFAEIKPLLVSRSEDKKYRVIISTVKGDIHDIGKNIVAMMLENHGFEVKDLGKDVDSELIIKEAVEYDADIICLSSLLTTTMGEMKKVSGLIKERGLKAELLIGGAVVTRDYAESIGAIYGQDAVEGVREAKKIINRI